MNCPSRWGKPVTWRSSCWENLSWLYLESMSWKWRDAYATVTCVFVGISSSSSFHSLFTVFSSFSFPLLWFRLQLAPFFSLWSAFLVPRRVSLLWCFLWSSVLLPMFHLRLFPFSYDSSSSHVLYLVIMSDLCLVQCFRLLICFRDFLLCYSGVRSFDLRTVKVFWIIHE